MKPALPTSEAEEQANTAMVEMSYLFTPGPLIQHLYKMHQWRDYHHYRDLEGVCNRLYEQNSRIYWDVFPALRVMQTW